MKNKRLWWKTINRTVKTFSLKKEVNKYNDIMLKPIMQFIYRYLYIINNNNNNYYYYNYYYYDYYYYNYYYCN